MAACYGHTEVAELLIKFGINVNEKDNFGSTPLAIAINLERNDVAELLRRNGGKE
jgi:ankyrin repeat protein